MAQRRTIVFSGRVQGVGFRLTAIHCAHDLPVTGTVRNLPDGSVELIVDGTPADIDTLIARLREHFAGLIRNVSQESSEAPAPSGHGRGIQVIY